MAPASSTGLPREAKRVYGETIPTTDPSKRYLVLKQAVRCLRRHHAVELPAGHDHARWRRHLAAGCTVIMAEPRRRR